MSTPTNQPGTPRTHQDTSSEGRHRRRRSTVVFALIALALAVGAGAGVHYLRRPEPPTHLCGILPTQELVPLVGDDPHQDFTNDDAPPIRMCQVSAESDNQYRYMIWESKHADYITQYLGDELKPTQTREQVGDATLATYLQARNSACAYWIEGEHAWRACVTFSASGDPELEDASDLIEPVKELVRTYGHQALSDLYPDTTPTPTPTATPAPSPTPSS